SPERTSQSSSSGSGQRAEHPVRCQPRGCSFQQHRRYRGRLLSRVAWLQYSFLNTNLIGSSVCLERQRDRDNLTSLSGTRERNANRVSRAGLSETTSRNSDCSASRDSTRGTNPSDTRELDRYRTIRGTGREAVLVYNTESLFV